MRKKKTVTAPQINKDFLQEAMGRVVRTNTDNHYAEEYTQYIVRRELNQLYRRERRERYLDKVKLIIWFVNQAMASFNYNFKIDTCNLREVYRDICHYHEVGYSDLYSVLREIELEDKEAQAA